MNNEKCHSDVWKSTFLMILALNVMFVPSTYHLAFELHSTIVRQKNTKNVSWVKTNITHVLSTDVEAIFSSHAWWFDSFPGQISGRIVHETTQVHVTNNSVVSCL